MTEYGEYASVHLVRRLFLNSASTVDDTLIRAFIQQVSREIDLISGRQFYPTIGSKRFDTPSDTVLNMNDELMTLTSITNGDGSSIDITSVLLLPANAPCYSRIKLPQVVAQWRADSNGESTSAITVTGTWCHAHDKTAGWQQKMTLTAEMTISATSFSAAVDMFHAGDLLRVGDELVSVTSIVSPVAPATTDTVNVERPVNGSVAVGHPIGTAVSLWVPGRDIQMLTAAASVAYYQLRSNPVASSFTLDGVTFETPQDVSEFIRKRLSRLQLVKIGFA